MNDNKNKFLTLISKEKTNTSKENLKRIQNRQMIRKTKKIALNILMRLDELGWSIEYLSKTSGLDVKHITESLKGKSKFSNEDLKIYQKILQIQF